MFSPLFDTATEKAGQGLGNEAIEQHMIAESQFGVYFMHKFKCIIQLKKAS